MVVKCTLDYVKLERRYINTARLPFVSLLGKAPRLLFVDLPVSSHTSNYFSQLCLWLKCFFLSICHRLMSLFCSVQMAF